MGHLFLLQMAKNNSNFLCEKEFIDSSEIPDLLSG
ncbi:hypothetical protein CCP4SC76_5490002 [Gammaproteobacteria bacterium]